MSAATDQGAAAAAGRPQRQQVLLSWSGGKDSALSLHALLEQPETYEVVGLLTTVTESTAAAEPRVASHHVRYSVLQAQVAALALPTPTPTTTTQPVPAIVVFEARLPPQPKNDAYEAAMFAALQAAIARFPNLQAVAFGDLYLQDIRDYREGMLARFNAAANAPSSGRSSPSDSPPSSRPALRPLFPLWGQDTAALARRCIALGFKARLVCVDTTQLDAAAFAGRDYDAALVAELERLGKDPCLENGEAHTFVWDGPVFARPVAVVDGEGGAFSRPGDGRFAYWDLSISPGDGNK